MLHRALRTALTHATPINRNTHRVLGLPRTLPTIGHSRQPPKAQFLFRRRLAAGGVVDLDVLEEHGFAELRSSGSAKGEAGVAADVRKIGLLTNQTGVDAAGRRTIDVLSGAPGVSLTAIFSPEHGVTGALEPGTVQRDAGVHCGESPTHLDVGLVAACLPSGDLIWL